MTRHPLQITLLSPYHGGSHRAWAEGLVRHSAHEIKILDLPAQFWKWRMHGAALLLADRFRMEIARTDLLVSTDMLDLALFLARTRDLTAATPTLLYVHENQLTYPLPDDPKSGPMRRQLGERDRHYAWINVTSMLMADAVRFNSRFHREQFLGALPAFLNHYPDAKDARWVEEIAARSDVLAPGIDLERFSVGIGADNEPFETSDDWEPMSPRHASAFEVGPPVILWNQRWEYDKDPETFFAALTAVAERGGSFRLIVCGENPRQSPEEFDAARARFADRIVHWGLADDAQYVKLLRRSDVVVSTARHEYFGIAVVEAMSAGALAILPARLNYPDLVPESLHSKCLYTSFDELVDRLSWALSHRDDVARLANELRDRVQQYDWSRIVTSYDALFEESAARRISG